VTSGRAASSGSRARGGVELRVGRCPQGNELEAAWEDGELAGMVNRGGVGSSLGWRGKDANLRTGPGMGCSGAHEEAEHPRPPISTSAAECRWS
jgi:hypothetical protein